MIHDEDKPSIKISSSTGTLSDSAVDKMLTMLSDDMSFELSNCMNYCVIGGFENEHHTQKVMNDMRKIGGIDITKNGGPPPRKQHNTRTAGGTTRAMGKDHGAGMNEQETQKMNQLESDVTELKTDMAQVKIQNQQINTRLDDMSESMGKMESARQQDSTILAMLATHFKLEPPKNRDTDTSPQAPGATNTEASPPADQYNVDATPSQRCANAQAGTHPGLVLETPEKEIDVDMRDARGTKRTNPSPVKIDFTGAELTAGKRGWLHVPPRTGSNETTEWTALPVILTHQVGAKKWWGVDAHDPEPAPVLLDEQDFFLDSEASNAALAVKIAGKRARVQKAQK